MLELLKCPNCAGEIHFAPGSPLTTCQHCNFQVKMQAPLPPLPSTDGPALAETIAVKSVTGNIFPLIERGTKLPFEKQETLSTAKDNQEVLHVDLVAGANPTTEDHRMLIAIEYPITGRGPRGVQRFHLRLNLAADGEVYIQVREEGTDSKTQSHKVRVSVA
jgi:molecular chaperone DnaK (HSP70)